MAGSMPCWPETLLPCTILNPLCLGLLLAFARAMAVWNNMVIATTCAPSMPFITPAASTRLWIRPPHQGVMYECVKANVPFVLAGSLRDDGPLPDCITDMNEAQDAYAAQLEGAGVVLCLSSMLHSIAVGNMLPAWVKIVCVDINPAVPTKVSDRGTGHALGVVTDVGLFLS